MTRATLRGRPGGFASDSSRTRLGERVTRVIAYRRILVLLIGRDLKVRYSGSVLGYAWTILDPLLMTGVYWAVFTQIFNRDAGPEFRPYMLYLITGQLPFFWFRSAVTAGAKALRSEAQMVRSSNVPRELWVLRAVLSRGVEYFCALPIIALFAIIYMKPPVWYVVFLPLAWILEVAMLIGIGLALAPLTVLLRDLDRIIPIVLRVLLYASPVLYSTTRLPPNWQFAYQFNPTIGWLELTHAAFFPAAMRWDFVWHSTVACVVILWIGIFVFTRLERPVLKEI